MALLFTNESHLDHGLKDSHLRHLLEVFADRNEFFIETVELPEHLSPVECGLHGPATGDSPIGDDEVEMVERNERGYKSRTVDRLARPTRKLTVIAGPHAEHKCMLYTSFGGPLAPKEPNDPTLTDEQRKESEEFWAEHALSRV